jgi:uncharacterized membrane protein
MFNASILNNVWKLRSSYWFIPSLMAFSAILLSFITIGIDSRLGEVWPGDISWLHRNRPEGARALLSTLAGSMITVASVTFSMTISSVSYATSQIGPRLITNFMRDRMNQVTLGTFIATFIYCLLILRTIVGKGEPSDEGVALEAFVPHLSILVSIFFSLASVAVLIIFIHHIPESINVSNIVARIGADLEKFITSLLPEDPAEAFSKDRAKILPPDFFNTASPVESEVSGYVQVLDTAGLVQIASEHGLLIRQEYRPGDFALKGDTLLYISPASRLNEELAAQCRGCFAFGRERTQNQDLLFLVDQLVEIIARALSPGVNDPYTAISAMDWLKCALHAMLLQPEQDGCSYDEEGRLRLVAHPISFERFASEIFDKTRPYLAGDHNAAVRAMETLGELIFKAQDDRREILMHHAEILEAACAVALAANEKEAVTARYKDIKKGLADPECLFALKDSPGWLGGTA